MDQVGGDYQRKNMFSAQDSVQKVHGDISTFTKSSVTVSEVPLTCSIVADPKGPHRTDLLY